ncbi:MAG TPA: S-layer homology domain-containing protein [Paenibacillus sp.]
MRSRIRLIVTWLCMISLVMGMPSMALGAGSSNSDPTWPNPGSIQLSKTATPTGNFGEWKIQLTVEGKQLKTKTDIVLVIDKSGSMNDGKRLSNAKVAAKSFADTLLTSGSDVRLAAVSFSSGSATSASEFMDASKKDDFKKVIDKISASGGTNIQAGLKAADDLLQKSTADKKYIVLLSDGEPTYSYKGQRAEDYTWPGGKYSFRITEFNNFNNEIGSGSSFDLSLISSYKINTTGGPTNYTVTDNGLPTISHAKLILDKGINIYTIGLEVGNNKNAQYVLNNSQNRGYYSANSDDLQKVFAEISNDIKFAARDAVVTDPMGEKFNLQPGAMDGKDFEVSQGTVIWNSEHETFEWNVGTVSEGKPATLTYVVVIDPSSNPLSDTLYPTNGKTTIDYTNVYGAPHVVKEFTVPKVKIGLVKILVKGYTVNSQGQPIDKDGKVTSPELAQQLYSDYYKVDGKDTFPVGGKSISVSAQQVNGYGLKVGDDPTVVTLKATADNIVMFGYAKVKSVTVKYVDSKSKEEIDRDVIENAFVGDLIDLKAKTISGYTPEAPTTDSYLVEDKDNNEYTFYYTKDEPEEKFTTVTVRYVEVGKEDEDIITPDVIENAVVGKHINLEAKTIPGYKNVSPTSVNYLVEDKEYNEVVFLYTKDEPTDPEENLMLTIYYLDRETGEPIADLKTEFGFEGKEITLYPKVPTVTDAVYVPEELSHSYTFTDALEQHYEFYYNKQVDPEPVEYTVTIKYLEQGTNRQLATPTTEKGKLGDTLTLKAVSVSGYTPTKSSVSYEIEAGESLEYIFYYTKNSSGNPDPSGPSSGGSYTTPLPPPPPVAPLPPVPPKLDTENHFDYIQGYPDGNVKPQNNISREEVAAIFYRLMEGESRANYYSTTNSYSDVKDTRWSNKHISTMANAGIITGYPDGTFRPGQAITRAEFAAIAARFDKLDERESGLFTDISGHWAEKYILSAGNKGWIKGYTDGTFKPNQYITRAEAMSFINSVLNRKVKESGILEDAKKWPDNPATSWYYEDVIEATNNHDYSRNADGYETWEQLKPHRVEP